MLEVRNVFCGTYAASGDYCSLFHSICSKGRIMSLNEIRNSHGSRIIEFEESIENRPESRSLDDISCLPASLLFCRISGKIDINLLFSVNFMSSLMILQHSK